MKIIKPCFCHDTNHELPICSDIESFDKDKNYDEWGQDEQEPRFCATENNNRTKNSYWWLNFA